MNDIKNKYDSDLLFNSDEPEYFKSSFFCDCSAKDIFQGCEPEQKVEISGRIVRKRIFGKLIFADLYSEGFDVQIVFDKNTNPQAWEFFSKYVSIADIVGVCGKTGKTKNGTDSVWVSKISILTKAILPLPDKYHGVKNVQTCRYAAYLDVLSNREKYNILQRRSQVIQAFRNVLIENRYLEVDTPILSVSECASNARQFVAHHNVLDCPVYLRVSAELQLKQMVLSGYNRVFEFCRNFRNEGTDKYHRQEFMNLEIFSAYSTIAEMKKLVVKLLKSGCDESGIFVYKDRSFCIDNIPTYDIHQMILNCLGIDILAYETLDLLKNVMKQKGLVDATSEKELTNKTACINRLVDICVKYDGFYFLKGYPAELYPLCKTEDGTCFADMEYLFFNGMCVAQLCKEETNPLRLNEMLVLQAENSNKNVSADESFITAISHGLPPMCGIGLSMERLIMLLCGCDSLYESNFFHLTKK